MGIVTILSISPPYCRVAENELLIVRVPTTVPVPVANTLNLSTSVPVIVLPVPLPVIALLRARRCSPARRLTLVKRANWRRDGDTGFQSKSQSELQPQRSGPDGKGAAAPDSPPRPRPPPPAVPT